MMDGVDDRYTVDEIRQHGDEVECPPCNTRHRSLAQHIQLSDHGYPMLTDDYVESIIGCLISRGMRVNGSLAISNTSRDIVEYWQEYFGPMTGKITIFEIQNGEEFNGYTVGPSSKRYQVRLMKHPEVMRLVELFYDDDLGAFIPPGTVLSPLAIRAWCINVGVPHEPGYTLSFGHRAVHPTDAERLFEDVDVRGRFKLGSKNIYLTTDERDRLCGVVGEPPDGMEDRWP